MVRTLWPGLFAALLSLFAMAHAQADSLESVLMPGKVIEGHADLEDNCKNCHVRFNKAGQNALCLDCHKDITSDMQQGRGYHGRLDKDRDCRECHTDHKGRNMNIAPLDEKKFDHEMTDFPLRGGHIAPGATCRDCHKPKSRFREALSACVACHKKDDKHKGGLGNACANCHVERNWKEVRFDHSKSRFPLDGRHADVACKDCHKDPGFRDTPMTCIACHKKDDRHKTRFGDKCETCHNDKNWKTITFDHDRDTKYRLRGKHTLAKCTTCHTGPLYREKLPTTCISCHRRDDTHKGRYGDKCQDCHVEKDWKAITFDHGRDTKYPLRGKHALVKCSACHNGPIVSDKLQTRCISCHLKDDKHKGQEGKQCESCHNETNWNKARIDHGLTRFPLLGKHADVVCKKCHITPAFRDASTVCGECHAKEDTHKRRLGNNCGMCHNAKSWKSWQFDHDHRTRFRLDGGHKGIQCEACHKRPMSSGDVSLSGSCISCHDGEDVHDGSFGRQCERCHMTSSFKKLKPGSGLGVRRER